MHSQEPRNDRFAELAYNAIGDSFSVALAVVDPELTIHWVNPAAQRVLGWPEEEIVGRNAAELIHPDDIEHMIVADEMFEFVDGIQEPFVPSAPIEMPCRILRSDGGWTPMSVTGRVQEGGEYTVAVVRPAAERHALAEVLDGLGAAAPLDETLRSLLGLVMAQFDTDKGWIAHDIDGGAEVIGCDPDPLPFDPTGVLARVRAFDSDEWFILVEGPLWVIPVTSDDSDRVFAAFVIPAQRPQGPSPWDELVAHRTANLTAMVFARNLRDRMLEVAATTDHLTGLLNRREFGRALKRQADNGIPVTLFFLDLDDFKAVNDDFGHLAGDAVLVNVGRRLQRVVRSSDEAGRLGGDEFVVSCPRLRDTEVEPMRQRIESVVGEPVAIDGRKLAVGVSVGVARAFTEEQLDTLITRSDADMFERKRTAKETAAGYGALQTPGSWPR